MASIYLEVQWGGGIVKAVLELTARGAAVVK